MGAPLLFVSLALVGLYVLVVQLFVLGRSFNLIPSTYLAWWGPGVEAFLVLVGGGVLTLASLGLTGSPVMLFALTIGTVALLVPAALLWRRYTDWASMFRWEEELGLTEEGGPD